MDHLHAVAAWIFADENQGAQPMAQDIHDPLEVPEGPITRSRAKKIKDDHPGSCVLDLIVTHTVGSGCETFIHWVALGPSPRVTPWVLGLF